ncbi:hypothetical protein [Paraburkholderia terricola]|uniref:Uncharacterized protein n=1 Tax=Paraburkholderia terricola TaxID=169427 RepID=A0ABU1LZU5_9BURK|nr:hypothetical protein [Paraburkholderia terricola]MDR6412291.1 hypothetical protein [Paraburkholderia terricola]MDR6484646.1 hypothetical protein [Paraburkholderia terricola]
MSDIDTERAVALLSPEHDSHAKRPEAARLADLIDHIEAAIARGVSREEVLARLHESGFTMSLRTFDKALYRIRKRLGKPQRRCTPSRQPSAPTAHSRAPTDNGETQTETLPGGRSIKTADQLRRENPTMPSTQISKLYAQQYAEPVVTSEELEEMKRKYNPPLLKR